MTRPSIEDAKQLQRSCGLGHTHLVWLDDIGFTIAHTDEERKRARAEYARMPTLYLELCPIHIWLQYNGDLIFATIGWYTVDENVHPYKFKLLEPLP